jgi:predicted MFS family arabinose efflux permease
MGVGAVFISTLARARLPVPHDPPQNEKELLAASLQPIVAFVVLGSILTRKGHYTSSCFVEVLTQSSKP